MPGASFLDETDPQVLAVRLQELKDHEQVQDRRLDEQGKDIERVRIGQWKIGAVTGGLALLGAGLGTWFAVMRALAELAAKMKVGG